MALSNDPSVRRHSYAALEGPGHIRLLVLHPALSKGAPLRVDFVSSTLEDLEGRYDAVSYTWGQPILSFALLLDDGTQVYVTENLDRALRYLRYNDRDRLLWADAACINQSDNAEKAVQIPLMVDIFRGGQRVMAWLDPGGDTTVEQSGMRIIERLSRTSKQRYVTWARGYREVIRFISLPWFNRLWIVQEVVFNSEVCMICGDTEIAFPRFVAGLSFIQEEVGLLEDDDRARVDAIVKIGRLWSRRSIFSTQFLRAPLSRSDSNTDSNDITSLVETFALYACTDPRDRVFALFSMAANVREVGYVSDDLASWTSGEQGVVSMSIDYSLNVLETYKAFALSCWKESHTHADMWGALILRQRSSPPDDWPSWVPDWRVAPRETISINGDGFHFDCRIISATRSGIRVELGRDKLWPHEDNDDVQPYTIRSKVARESFDSEASYESQLLELCKIVTKSETARDSDPLAEPDKYWLSETRQFPDFLHKTIRDSVLRLAYGTGSDESQPENPCNMDSLHELIQYLSSEDMPPGGWFSRYSSKSTSSKCHDQASNGTANVFVFHDPNTQTYSIGYSDVSIDVGDHIVPMRNEIDGYPDGVLMVAMILRPADPLERSIDKTPTYRFVGTGRIYDPTHVLARNLFKLNDTKTISDFLTKFKSNHFINEFNVV